MKKWYLAIILAIFILNSPLQAQQFLIKADLELDTTQHRSTEENGADDGSDQDITINSQAGDVNVDFITNIEKDNWFAKGQVSLLAITDGTTEVEDAWGMFGSGMFDVQFGRFEAMETFGYGKDMLVAEAPEGPEFYEVNHARGYGPGAIAFHVNPENLKFELNTIFGNEDDMNHTGYRPSFEGVYCFSGNDAECADENKQDIVKLTLTHESVIIRPFDDDLKNQEDKTGNGVRLVVKFTPVEVGFTYTQSTVGGEDELGNSLDDTYTDTSAFYVNLAVGEGELGAAVYQTKESFDKSKDESTHNQYFLAYEHPLPIEDLSVTGAFSNATAEIDPDGGSSTENSANAFGIRVNYNFGTIGQLN